MKTLASVSLVLLMLAGCGGGGGGGGDGAGLTGVLQVDYDSWSTPDAAPIRVIGGYGPRGDPTEPCVPPVLLEDVEITWVNHATGETGSGLAASLIQFSDFGSRCVNRWGAEIPVAIGSNAVDITLVHEGKREAASITIVRLAPVPVAESPTFDPPPGIYSESQLVRLTCATPESSIRYTTDGSLVSDEPRDPLYEAPIPVDATVTIRARAFAPGMDPSPMVSATYEIVRASPTVSRRLRDAGSL